MSSELQRQHPFWERLVWLEPFWQLLLAPSVLFPGRFWAEGMQPFLIGSLFLFWPIRWFTSGRVSVKTSINGWVALLLLWLPVTLVISLYRPQSWASSGYLVLGIAFFFAAVNWAPFRKRPQWILLPLLAGSLALSLIGPQLMEAGVGSRLFRVAQLDARTGLLSSRLGEDVNPNVFAGSLVMVIPLAFALALEWRWSLHRIWPFLCGLVGLVGLGSLIVTQSRGAYLSVGIALLLLIALRWRRLFWLTLLLLVGAIIVGRVVGLEGILDQLSSDTSLIGLSGRLEIWQRGFWTIQDFVFTGIGYGLFSPVVPTLYPFFLLPTDIPHAHNLILQIGVDMGLVGIVAYLGIISSVLILVGKTLSRTRKLTAGVVGRGIVGGRTKLRRTYFKQAIAAGVFASIIGMLVHGLFDAVTWGTKLAFIPWLIFALGILNHRNLYRERRRRRRRRRSV